VPIYFQLTLILNLKTNRRMSKVFLMFTSDGIAEKPWVWENTWHLADPTIFFGDQKIMFEEHLSRLPWIWCIHCIQLYIASVPVTTLAQPGSVTFRTRVDRIQKGWNSIDIRRTFGSRHVFALQCPVHLPSLQWKRPGWIFMYCKYRCVPQWGKKPQTAFQCMLIRKLYLSI